MAKDPAFLFYPNDWLGGTMGMTFEEKGAYMELLMLQFNRGHMTKDMIGRTVGQLWVNIKDKFKEDSDGCFYNERLEDEKNKRKAFSESRRNNRKGVNQYTKPEPKKEGHMTSHMEDVDVNENLVISEIKENDFDIFWKAFNYNVGLRQTQDEWLSITKEMPSEIAKILVHVPKYVLSKPDKKYRKKPENYLKERIWQDEIDEVNNEAKKDIPVHQRSYDERIKFAEENGIKLGSAQYNRLVNKTGL